MKLAAFPGILALSAVLALVPGMVAAETGDEQRETETVDRSFPFNPDGHVKLRNFSGDIKITGSNRANVVVHAVRRAPKDRLEGIRLVIDATASEISIDANKKNENWQERDNDVVETEFVIEVPERVTLDVHAFSSEIHVAGVQGKQKLHTFSGEINVDQAVGPLDAETFSGDIEVNLVPSAGGRVDFNSFSGSLDTNLPMTYRSGKRRNISGDIGSGGSTSFNFKTFSGDVRLK
jgi:DUF4097 and DUF4098 domain-containing protein YvlB